MNEDAPSPDHVAEEEKPEHTLEENVKSRSTWLRLFFMIVVFFLYAVSRAVVAAVVVLQFFTVLFTGRTNEPLQRFGASLSTYSYQIVLYLTFNTEEKPFPFDQSWPTKAPDFRS